jgi:hypothetical protein
MDPHTGEDLFLEDELQQFGDVALTLSSKLQITPIERADWPRIITLRALHLFHNQRESDKLFGCDIRVSTIDGAGKSRIITVPNGITKIIQSSTGHRYQEILKGVPELDAGLSTGHQLWEAYRSWENHNFGDWKLHELQVLTWDFDEATDYPSFEAGRDSLRYLQLTARTPAYLAGAEYSLMGGRIAYLQGKKIRDCLTQRGILMGDGNTKSVLTELHYRIMRHIEKCVLDAITDGREFNLFFRLNGDNGLIVVPYRYTDVAEQALRDAITASTLKLSEDELYIGRYAFYCERLCKLPRQNKSFFPIVIQQPAKFAVYSDYPMGKMMNFHLSNCDSAFKDSIMSKIASLSRSWSYPNTPEERSRIERVLSQLYSLCGSRVRHEWKHHPLTHDTWLWIPRSEYICTRQHRYLYHIITTLWGYTGNHFRPKWGPASSVNPVTSVKLRRKAKERKVYFVHFDLPEEFSRYEIPTDPLLAQYLHLCQLTNIIHEDELKIHVIKYINNLDLLFPREESRLEQIVQEVTTRKIPHGLPEVSYDEWVSIASAFSRAFRRPGRVYNRSGVQAGLPYLKIPDKPKGFYWDEQFEAAFPVISNEFTGELPLNGEFNDEQILCLLLRFQPESLAVRTDDAELISTARSFADRWAGQVRWLRKKSRRGSYLLDSGLRVKHKLGQTKWRSRKGHASGGK